jgi:phosphoribosylformimino-5-aminoimidazole carboxamide ribotide isomerase
MKVIPAIDLQDGHCVRLLQGKPGSETVYGNDPLEMALRWQRDGAEWLHVVDLDAAFGRGEANRDAIRSILSQLQIPVQVGGGIRSRSEIGDLLESGAARIVFGTAAVESPQLVREAMRMAPDKVAVGVDVRHGKVATRGWEGVSSEDPVDFGKRWKQLGASIFICTDISRDGSLEGPNIEALRHFAQQVGARIVASGGVSTLDDLQRLRNLEPEGVEAVIIGKALYEGAFSLEQAIEVTEY